MKRISFRVVLNLFLTSTLFLLFTACGGGDNSEVLAPPSVDEGGTTTPIGTVSTAGFWVRSENSEFPAYVNRSNGFGNECIINPDDPLGTITCYVDVMELDLYSNAVDLQYNIPPDMCQHLAVTPSWHWNYSSGRGPRDITVEVTTTDAGERIDTCVATRDDGGNANCAPGVDNHPEIAGFNDSGVPNCVYNHSLRDTDLPNCCLGSYNILKRLDSDNNGSYDTITSTTADWGGNVTNCIGGGPRNSVGSIGQSGYPITTLTQVPADGGTGLNAALSVNSNITGPSSGFSYQSNFYTTVGSPHTHSGFSTAATSTLPYAFNPIDDLDGSLYNTNILRPGVPGYTFTCLDEADDVKYAIFVFIREWNTVSEFFAYGTSEGALYNPDVNGAEGGPCPGIEGSCNDFVDFDDLLVGAGGTYDTGPGVDFLDRNDYFPEAGY